TTGWSASWLLARTPSWCSATTIARRTVAIPSQSRKAMPCSSMWPSTPGVCRGPLVDEEGYGVVLGRVFARRLQARRHPRLADQRQLRATQGPAPDAAFRRRERRAARRGGGLWAQARGGRRDSHIGSKSFFNSIDPKRT